MVNELFIAKWCNLYAEDGIISKSSHFIIHILMKEWDHGRDCKNPNEGGKQNHHFPILTLIIMVQQFFYNSCWVIGEYKFLSFTADARRFEKEQAHLCLLQSRIIYLDKVSRLYFEQFLTNLNDPDILLHQERKRSVFKWWYSDYSVLFYKQTA